MSRVFTALMCLGLPAVAAAQDPNPLDRPARLHVVNVRLSDAVDALSLRSGVPIAYSRRHLPESAQASCACQNVSVATALDSLLRGTNLRYEWSGRRVLLLPPPTRLPRTIVGTVLSVEERTPIPHAVLDVLGTDVQDVTNADGEFTLAGIPDTARLIRVRVAGVVPDTVPLPTHATKWTMFVRAESFTLRPIIVTTDVTPDRTRFDEDVQTSTVTFDRQQIVAIPSAAEPDVLRAVQSLPGTVTRNDFSVGYNVRGGENDQNLVRLDGIQVLNPTHLGGVFGSFDPNTIDRFEFLTGGFPASYGGRLSSVLDLTVDEGRRDGIGVQGQVSLLSSKLAVGGPIGPGTFMIGARRTYADWVVATFTRHTLPYHFSDLTGKIAFPIGRTGSIAFTGFLSSDRLNNRLIEPDTARGGRTPIDLIWGWGNAVAGVTWTQLVGSATVTTRASTSSFATDFVLSPDIGQYDNSIHALSAGTEITTKVGLHSVTAGVSVDRFAARYEVSEPQLGAANQRNFLDRVIPIFNRRYRPTVWAGYLDTRLRVGSRVRLRPGVRVEHVTGPDQTVVGPSMAAKVSLDPETALTVSAGRYFQAVHSLRDQDFPVTVFEFWVGADQDVPVARSDHLIAGVERWMGRRTQIVIEAYRKTFSNLVIPNRALALRDTGREFLPMHGSSWGIDVLVRRHQGAIRGWFGYSFAKADRETAEQRFPASHDRRHTVNAVLETDGPLGTTMGARWVYGSPLPFTGVVGEWSHLRYSAATHSYWDATDEPISTAINNRRFPSYSRLDVSFRGQFATLGAHFSPYLQLTNVYNRRNVFLYVYNYSANPPERSVISQVPIFPTVGLEFAW